jgi:hypothetical protein
VTAGRKISGGRTTSRRAASSTGEREGTTAEDADGVGEALDDTLRTVLTVAAQLGERAARLREQAVRQAEARADQQTRELAARHDAERAAARIELAPVVDPGWWATADSRDIAGMWETATA